MDADQALTIAQATKKQGGMDIMAVLVRISVDAAQRTAQLLVADSSIPDNTYARISLRGVSVDDLSVGDVLCFHGLVRQKNGSSVKSPLVGDFRVSWQDPQTTNWTRLHHHGDESFSPDERIRQLVTWFSPSKFHMDSIIPTLPQCRRRRLRELTSGIVCHVVVRIVSIDTVAGTPTSNASRKRKRFSLTSKSTVAVLTDSNEVMPFMDCEKYETALKSAMNAGQQVLLTNVVTTSAASNTEDVVLRPTDSTCVVPMSSTDSEQQCDEQTQQLLSSLTQEMIPGMATTVSSPLRDIFMDELGISLGTTHFLASPHGFLATILENDKKSYRPATLTLDGRVVVKADAAIMKTLCGSIEPDSLSNNTRLLFAVLELLRGLLQEETILTWTLEKQDDSYHVVKCCIPRL